MASKIVKVDIGSPFHDDILEKDKLEHLFCNQKFTPNGRYGISIPSGRMNVTGIPQLIVLDLAENKMCNYNPEGREGLSWDIFYCLSDDELILLKKPYFNGFAVIQTIIKLDHNKKTFSLTGSKNLVGSRENALNWQLSFEYNSQYATTVKYDKEDHIVWISKSDRTLWCHYLILVPKNPHSHSKLKVFYLNKQALKNNNQHEAIEHYRTYSMGRFRAPAEPIPVVIDDSLCFPFQVELEKLITGVWMRIDLQKLVNLAETEVVRLDNLNQIQEDAYSVISTPANGSDVETCWPLFDTDFYTDGSTFIQWRKNKVGPTYITDVHEGFWPLLMEK